MKTRLFFFLILSSTLVLGQSNNNHVKALTEISIDLELKKVASFSVQAPDVGLTTITLYNQTKWDDPGDFFKIDISNKKFSKSYSNAGGWVAFNKNYPVSEALQSLNNLDTDLILLVGDSHTSLLTLFGWVYASEAGLCTIIDLTSGELIINDNLELLEIDLKNDKIRFSNQISITCSGAQSNR